MQKQVLLVTLTIKRISLVEHLFVYSTPMNAQTTAQLHSSHILKINAQNSPSQASAIREP